MYFNVGNVFVKLLFHENDNVLNISAAIFWQFKNAQKGFTKKLLTNQLTKIGHKYFSDND